VTHASKTLPEFGRKDILKYPGAPGVDLIRDVIDNVEKYAAIAKKTIVFDHKVDCDTSCLYLKNLVVFCQQKNINLKVSPSALAMPSQITASNAFFMAVDQCKSEHLLLWEHDHLFLEYLNWDVIESAFSAGFKMVRFNRSVNRNQGDYVRETISALPGLSGLCRTNYYCNGPFVAKTEWCKALFKQSKVAIPSWNGCFGGFIEGPINRLMVADELNLSSDDFRSKYPICLYGDEGSSPVVTHFGDFPGRRARLLARIKSSLKR
jgi:hypothetical protein